MIFKRDQINAESSFLCTPHSTAPPCFAARFKLKAICELNSKASQGRQGTSSTLESSDLNSLKLRVLIIDYICYTWRAVGMNADLAFGIK